jgi:hypothetical protein
LDALANVQEWSKVPGCTIVYIDKEKEVSKKISKYFDYHLCFKSDDLMQAVADKMDISLISSIEKIDERRIHALSIQLKEQVLKTIQEFENQPGKLSKILHF